MNKMKFDWDDVQIMPKALTSIKSRFNDINLEYNPLFTAPMDTVVNVNNWELFRNLGINICLPRGVENREFYVDDEEVFRSMSLKEVKKLSEKDISFSSNICIDTANGHNQEIIEVAKMWKENQRDRDKLMVGNIANPETLIHMDAAGIDFIRCGIGTGSGCLTSQNSAIGYPMASLISECRKVKEENNLKIKIVADGGFNEYADIIKALALGADYVMLGGLFNKTLQSCAPTFMKNTNHSSWKETGQEINQYDPQYAKMLKNGATFYKKFRGMSTKEVQRDWGVEESRIRTSEGINKLNEVTDTLDGWHENFDHYLRSAMSYSGASCLEYFIGKAEWNLITTNSLARFKK